MRPPTQFRFFFTLFLFSYFPVIDIKYVYLYLMLSIRAQIAYNLNFYQKISSTKIQLKQFSHLMVKYITYSMEVEQ